MTPQSVVTEICRLLAFFTVSMIAVPAHAAESGRVVEVHAPLQVVVAWMNTHRDQLAASAHWQVVQRSGNCVRLRRPTPSGVLDVWLEERVSVGPNSGRYDCRLKQAVQGDVRSLNTSATLTPTATGCLLSIRCSAVIPRLSERTLQVGMEAGVGGLHRYLRSVFP